MLRSSVLGSAYGRLVGTSRAAESLRVTQSITASPMFYIPSNEHEDLFDYNAKKPLTTSDENRMPNLKCETGNL